MLSRFTPNSANFDLTGMCPLEVLQQNMLILEGTNLFQLVLLSPESSIKDSIFSLIDLTEKFPSLESLHFHSSLVEFSWMLLIFLDNCCKSSDSLSLRISLRQSQLNVSSLFLSATVAKLLLSRANNLGNMSFNFPSPV